MSLNLAQQYTLKRLWWIAGIPVATGVVAFGLAHPAFGWGALGATPVAAFNYALMAWAVRTSAGSGREGRASKRLHARILRAQLLRMVISLATLWAAWRFDVEVMLGALVALVAEMISYMGDTVRLIRKLR